MSPAEIFFSFKSVLDHHYRWFQTRICGKSVEHFRFHFLPCDRVPFSEIECSRYELNVRIVYPPSYGDKRTEIQKVIECRSGVGEIFPTVNIGPLQFVLGRGNIVRSIFLYFSGLKKEDFVYQADCGDAPLVSLALQDAEILQEDLYFNEQVAVKIDRDGCVVFVEFEENSNIYQTFSLSDNLIVHADKDNNLVSMVFRNVRWVDLETEPAVPQQNCGIIGRFLSALTRYVRK